jgi:glutamate-1-semialdehyde aminotransferase
MATESGVDRARLAALAARERAAFGQRNPKSAAAYADARHLFGQVPMTWMNKTAAGFPVYVATARGAQVTDIDGHEYVDFCLGDTGAMAGHSPAPVVAAVQHRLGALGGATTMLPTEDASLVGAELARRFGLPYDETHTFSAGPGGATRAWGLDPDVVTIGKAIAGGIPIGAYGLSEPLAAALIGRADLDLVDMGGVGGTLAGNPVSMAAARATLEEVLTDAAFGGMIATATAFTDGLRKLIGQYALPWSVSQLGARVEYRFADPAPVTGTESAASADAELEDFLHTYLANRGILLTPFHNMALMSPSTTLDDVQRHHEVFANALAELTHG